MTLKDLRTAIHLGDLKTVEKILPTLPSLDVDLGYGYFPVGEAAAQGQHEVLERLLSAGPNPDKVSEGNETALMFAIQAQSVQCVALLIKWKADVNRPDETGTPLNAAMTHATDEGLQIAKRLLEAGARVDPEWQFSPLWTAASEGNVRGIELLVNAGANLNLLSSRFGSALTKAVDEGQVAAVKLLLELGARWNVVLSKDLRLHGQGKSLLELAVFKKNKKILALLQGDPAPKPSEATVAATWKDLEAWLKKNAPELKKGLAKGADAKRLSQLEKEAGVSLPQDFRESYGIHDGQKEGEDCLVPPLEEDEPGFVLLSIETIPSEWKGWKGLIASGQFAKRTGSPDKGIAKDWWNPGWIPFASDGGGDLLCLDLAPAQGGKVGQVISMCHDSPQRRLLAGSFADWLASVTEQLQDNV